MNSTKRNKTQKKNKNSNGSDFEQEIKNEVIQVNTYSPKKKNKSKNLEKKIEEQINGVEENIVIESKKIEKTKTRKSYSKININFNESGQIQPKQFLLPNSNYSKKSDLSQMDSLNINSIGLDINSVPIESNLNNVYKSDSENEYGYVSDEENIRPPIPVKMDRLFSSDSQEDLKTFIQDIMSDKTIEPEMKQIIIESRREFILKEESKAKKRAEIAHRQGILNPLIIKLKDANITKIIPSQKENILIQFYRWINIEIDLIDLESDQLIQLFELIDEMSESNILPFHTDIKNIFIPSNPIEYAELVEIMHIIKAQSIQDEEDRLKKIQAEEEAIKLEELKIKELEEKKNMLKDSRINQVNLLLINLNKLAGFDPKIKNLKTQLEIPISLYLGLETESIMIESELYQKTIQFINSIRIRKEDKELILSICEEK